MNNPPKQIMEYLAFYTSGQDVVDIISPKQLKELGEATTETDKGETISCDELKKK